LSTKTAFENPSAVQALVVLDTNAVLDVWVFHDPRADALRRALAAGTLTWICSDHMLAELADVLRRPALARWCADPGAVFDDVRKRAHVVEAPIESLAARCKDPDDQCFIDLACGWPASWLITHDRALLALSKSAEPRGVSVCTPEAWHSGPVAHRPIAP
jgi:putative PIN family toxin of toxin-antitoxin system